MMRDEQYVANSGGGVGSGGVVYGSPRWQRGTTSVWHKNIFTVGLPIHHVYRGTMAMMQIQCNSGQCYFPRVLCWSTPSPLQ
jgi:hypothetical protein